MFWTCRNREVVTLRSFFFKKKKPTKVVSTLWHKPTLGLQGGDVCPQWGRLRNWPGQPGLQLLLFLGARRLTPAQVWDNISVPCGSPHVLSFVEQWCLLWTCFLVLHSCEKNFFLYFCWRLNICINCKYIWFITVKALVPIGGFSSFKKNFFFNHSFGITDVGFIFAVRTYICKEKLKNALAIL